MPTISVKEFAEYPKTGRIFLFTFSEGCEAGDIASNRLNLEDFSSLGKFNELVIIEGDLDQEFTPFGVDVVPAMRFYEDESKIAYALTEIRSPAGISTMEINEMKTEISKENPGGLISESGR